MNERVKFIARYLQNEECFAALCEEAGISRKIVLGRRGRIPTPYPQP